MSNKHLFVYLALGAAIGFGSCASEPTTAPDGAVYGSGGHVGPGGAPGSGGRTGAGGSQGSGGRTGSGGSTGTGGVKGSGGRTGTGGVVGSGGRSGSGGSTSVGTCTGYATRFWDCCKPHCGWSSNVPSGVNPMNSCSAGNQKTDSNAQSACSGGNAYMCHGLTPWAVNSNLAYGFAATSSGDICGRCYQLTFTGTSFNAGNDAGSQALAGKTMIIQAMNIGYDVSHNQFDILVPGGGVGAFNACSTQWGVSNNDLGAQYGGFLATCKQQNSSYSAYKSCLLQKCSSVFGTRGLTQLEAGCKWYADWFQAADNPSVKFKEVVCPPEIIEKSGMNRTSKNDINKSCG